MLAVDQHAFDLQNAIMAVHDPDRWMEACGWLRVAAGLREVACDSRHDTDAGWCGQADEWSDRTDAVRSHYLLGVTRLLFSCGALEAAARSTIKPSTIKKSKGILNAIARSLDAESASVPAGYLDVTWHIAISARHDEQFLGRIRAAGHQPVRIAGAFLAYEFRNRLAHGVLRWPDTDDEQDGALGHELHLVDLSTRAVLMTLQMLAIAQLARPLDRSGDDSVDSGVWTTARAARLANLHLFKPRGGRRAEVA